jgi:EAL domain-containing protein (putative c-di-GMP-specific phosphodiesterase class I)
MTVIAEGVETRAQADYLRGGTCDEFQGFYFSKPMAAAELAALLQAPPHPQHTVPFAV